jgi:uncharacterized protein YbbC (DUF1343 family)
LKVQSVRCFVFHFILHNAYTVDACALTSIAFIVLDKYDILYFGHNSDGGVGSASIFRLIWIPLLHNLRNAFVMELRDSVAFSVMQTVMEFERIG